MTKKKIPQALTTEGYAIKKLTDETSSESEASDTENLNQYNNLSAENSNISRSSMQSKSIDLNDDDDNDNDEDTDNM